MTVCSRPDVAIWGMTNTRSLVTLQRVAEACVREGLRTLLLWWDYRGSGARTPADYPVEGLEFLRLSVRHDFGPLRYPHTLVLPLLQRPMERALRAAAPRCLVTQLDHTFADRVLQRAAKRVGIPGVVLQEGMTNVPKAPLTTARERKAWAWRWAEQGWSRKWIRALPHPLLEAAAPYLYADYAFVWGRAMKAHLVEGGRPPETIVVTGSPAMDHIVGRRPMAPAGRRTVLYIHQPIYASAGVKRRHYSDILRHTTIDLGCRLLFKLHPGQSHETAPVRALAAELGCPSGLVEVVDQGDAVQLLEQASVAVVASSTMGYHAAVAGVPLVVLDYYFDDIRFDVGASGGAVVVRDPGELLPALRRTLFDEAFREELYRGGGRLLEEHLLALDGGSARRTAVALREIVKKGVAA